MSNDIVLPTPEKVARQWSRKDRAFLDTRFRKDAFFRITTAHDSGFSVLDLIRADLGYYSKRRNNERFSVDWHLSSSTGNHPDLEEIDGKNIHVGSLPPPGNNGEYRQYTDILFLNGQLIVTPVTAEADQAEPTELRLGTIIGLTIVAVDRALSVWAE